MFHLYVSEGKRVDYVIREVSTCPQTPPRGMLQQPFRYGDSSMYASVGDINNIVESVVPGKSKLRIMSDILVDTFHWTVLDEPIGNGNTTAFWYKPVMQYSQA